MRKTVLVILGLGVVLMAGPSDAHAQWRPPIRPHPSLLAQRATMGQLTVRPNPNWRWWKGRDEWRYEGRAPYGGGLGGLPPEFELELNPWDTLPEWIKTAGTSPPRTCADMGPTACYFNAFELLGDSTSVDDLLYQFKPAVEPEVPGLPLAWIRPIGYSRGGAGGSVRRSLLGGKGGALKRDPRAGDGGPRGPARALPLQWHVSLQRRHVSPRRADLLRP